MGGGQSLNFGLAHLDTFAWVGGFSSEFVRVMPLDGLRRFFAARILRVTSFGGQDPPGSP